MLDLKFLANTPYFEEITLDKLEILFDEWNTDDNLYIIKEWTLGVEKYTTIERKETKQLGKLKENEIFWEWALNKSEPKQVKIIAIEKTVLLKINAKKWVYEFIKEYPSEWIELLTNIISLSNKRLLESNFLLTSSYQISKIISEIEFYNNKNLFIIIEEFKKILWVDYLIYLEKSPVMEDYLTVKYDTRKEWKMQNILIETQNNSIGTKLLKENSVNITWLEHIEELKNKNSNIGYLIIWDTNNIITELQKKVISSISTLIAWVIIQKHIYEEELNKEYIEI